MLLSDVVPRTQAALPRWKSTLTCCIKNSNDRCSFVVAAMRLPRSLKKAVASSLRAPSFSTATGMKQCVWLIASYLSCLRHSAYVATTPGPATARFRWLLAKVSQHVTSQTTGHRPCFHGIRDIPSGRLQSDLGRDVGSSLDGISAVARDLLIMSALCRGLAHRARWPGLMPDGLAWPKKWMFEYFNKQNR